MAAGLRNDTHTSIYQDYGKLAVEPPVIMLRVYCSCPGVSAMINLRLLVEK